ncbi:MAG: bifunctional hexulose-6-phosphate synthase/ribonuclease regulator [Actinobacteria bacterium RBG_16_64_13]|nr:MAG: bifunctional hexulose-6-phosphate synthase/ribonuclease regulator [Actinobacteria bacterium RBG_16_64_13]
MKPVLQLALDFVDLPRALQVAEEAVAGGAEWLEVGTPLIKSEGLQAIREIKARWPDLTIVADMKTMDAGRAEVECAAKAGARVVGVLGAASDATIKECVEAARNYGAEIVVDMIQVEDVVTRAREAEAMGASYVGIHIAIDEQMQGKTPWDTLRLVAEGVSIPVAVAGGINSETAPLALEAGASIVVVGGAITKAADATAATKAVKQAMETMTPVKSEYFVRATGPDIREMLSRVSAANVSDALHRSGDIPGMRPLAPGTKMVGPALTVRTAPGDWAKPVEAIDKAHPGDVLVVDAGGVLPAIWGELATNSAIQRGLAGVVIYGAARDTADIRALGFPLFSTLVSPTAGEAKGFGEIGVPIRIAGVRVSPGDWIIGDDDGVCVIPRDKAVEYTNRAMDVLEKENRLRAEIQAGSTLGQVGYLLRWEKN